MQPLAPSQNIHIIERFLLYSMYGDSSHAWLPGGFAYKSGLIPVFICMPASTLAYKDGPSASAVFSRFSRNERPVFAEVGGEPVSDLWYINNMERFPARAKDRRVAGTGRYGRSLPENTFDTEVS